MALRKKQRGVAAVEFGILIIPLTLMLFGLTEYARAIYQYNTLAKATRDAARYLSTVTPGSGKAMAQCLVLYGTQSTDCPDNDPENPNPDALAPYATKSMVHICDAMDASYCPGKPHALVSTGSGAINLVTVTISGYRFQSLINFPLAGLRVGTPDITFGDIGNTMRQAL
jgi:hypothetical protein